MVLTLALTLTLSPPSSLRFDATLNLDRAVAIAKAGEEREQRSIIFGFNQRFARIQP
jgi:hypothetical protein